MKARHGIYLALASATFAGSALAQVSLDGPGTAIVDYSINMNYVMCPWVAQGDGHRAPDGQREPSGPTPDV